MTTLVLQRAHLLTVGDYVALPKDAEVHHELQEGVLIPLPSPFRGRR